LQVATNLENLRVFDLEQPRRNDSPLHPGHQPPGSSYLMHRRHMPGAPERRTGAAGVWVTTEHSGTHIDAFAHQAEDMLLFGGREAARVQTPTGFTELGVETIGPIVARGWLIDLGVVEPGRWIELEEVTGAAERQGVSPEAGDVVLVRTGNGVHWADPARYWRGSGMRGRVSEWLAGMGVRAVGADNMAWDRPEGVDPDYGVTLPGHAVLLVRAGVYILENLFLEELSAAGVRQFIFVCLPLKLAGATGSPVRPIALVEP
jgi:kynurenine formamidase